MNAQEFVDKLKSIPSQKTIDIYRNKGLDDDFIAEYLGNYNFRKLDNTVEYDDPIKSLVNNYDGSTVTLGMITFDIEPEEDEDYYVFGAFEADILAINKNLKTIEMLEYGTDDHVLCKCAQNSSSFLDAVIEAAHFAEKCSSDQTLYQNKKALSVVIEKCGELAGGEDYLDFYKVMLGYDD